MNARSSMISSTILIAVGAIAFASGRLSAPPPLAAPYRGALEAETKPMPAADEAADTLMQVTPETITDVPFNAAYETLRRASPEILKRWVKELEEIPQTPKRRAAIRSFFRTLVQFDGRRTKELFLGLKEIHRWPAIMSAIDAAPPQALGEVMEMAQSFDPREISSCSWDLRRDIIDSWSVADPIAAKEFLEQHRTQNLERSYAALIRNWAAYDPKAAWEWMEQEDVRTQSEPPDEYGNKSEPGLMVADWVKGFFENDRAAALDYLLTADSEKVREAIPAVVGALFVESPEEARAFVLRLPEEQQAGAMSGVGMMADRFVYGDADDRIRSPESTADWMLRFPPQVWKGGIDRVISEWKLKNAEDLFAWMSKLPQDVQEGVVSQYESYLSEDDVEKEFTRIMKISDLALRNLLLQQVVLAAKSENSREAVSAQLTNAALDPAQQRYLVSLIPAEEKTEEVPDSEMSAP